MEYPGLDAASHAYPILQTYVDICVLGCLEFSREFAVEFIQSTVGWDGPWLNDRPVPRRPWVHQPKYKVIDQLLKDTIPEQFKCRKIPEEFGAEIILQARAQQGQQGSQGRATVASASTLEVSGWLVVHVQCM